MIVTLQEAEAYMATRYQAGRVWTSGVSNADKTAALTTAEVDLTSVFGELEAIDAHKKCVFEQALFRMFDPDVDLRSSLRRQGVTSAGVIKETYTDKSPEGNGVAICAYARQVLGSLVGGIDSVELTLEEDEPWIQTSL